MLNLKPHPAAERFPMLEGAELQSLADDIGANGLQEPITIYNGEILDGRNRYRACQMAGIEPRVVDYDGPLSPEAFVISMNIRRRHLQPGQIAMIVERMKPEFQDEAHARMIAPLEMSPKRPKAGDGRHQPIRSNHHGRVDEIVGSIGGVSGRSVARATAVRKADPVLADRVEAGEISLESAYQQVKGMTADRIPGSKKRDTKYKEKSSKQMTMEANCRQRVFDSLGTLDGVCTGLGRVNVERLRDGTDSDDRGAILSALADVVSRLQAFKRRLQNALT